MLAVIGGSVVTYIPTYASSSANVTITASGWIAGVPGGLTIIYVSDYEVQINWTKGEDAVNTMIRAAYGHAPTTISEGYQVYLGAGESGIDDSVALAGPDLVYYTAFSQNVNGIWAIEYSEEDTGHIMSVSFLFMGWLVLAIFFTWFSSKRPEMLIRLCSSLIWMGMGFWILLGGIENIEVGDSWIQILIWVFFIMAIVPFLVQMNTEIRRESKGMAWKEWGTPPEEIVDRDAEYRASIRRRIRKKRGQTRLW